MLDIVGESADSIALSFYFISTNNIFLIYNHVIQVVAMFIDQSGSMALFNVADGSGLYVYLPTGYAQYKNFSTDVSQPFSQNDLAGGIAPLLSNMAASITILHESHSTLQSDILDLGLLVKDLSKNKTSKALEGKEDLSAKLAGSLGHVMVAAEARFLQTSSSYNKALGCMNVLVGVMGTPTAYQGAFKDVVGYAAIAGFGYPRGQGLFTKLLILSMYAGGVLNGSIGNIKYVSLDNSFLFKNGTGEVLFKVNLATVQVLDGEGTVVDGLPGQAYTYLNTGISSNLYFHANY